MTSEYNLCCTRLICSMFSSVFHGGPRVTGNHHSVKCGSFNSSLPYPLKSATVAYAADCAAPFSIKPFDDFHCLRALLFQIPFFNVRIPRKPIEPTVFYPTFPTRSKSPKYTQTFEGMQWLEGNGKIRRDYLEASIIFFVSGVRNLRKNPFSSSRSFLSLMFQGMLTAK